ncbi:MAG: hypothetical protein IPJ65_38145 [Archangiaceae bacterium]|nr:hypothetical protein [Archangiaceae bacterium]
MISLDLETWPLAPGMKIPRPVSYSWAADPAVPSEVGLIKDLPDIQFNRIVGANTAFDMAVLWQYCDVDVWKLYENRQVTDILIRQQLIDIARGVGTKRKYSLGVLAKHYLGVELDKEGETRTSYHTVAHLPVSEWPTQYVEYARKDAECTYRVWEAQEKLKDENVKRWEHYETYSAFCLHLMSAWGVRADKAWWADLKRDVDAKYENLCQTYRGMGVMRPDGSKDKKVLQGLVNAAYNGNPPRTDKGAIKTDRLSLEESGSEVLESLTGDGPIEKIVTTYGKVVEEATVLPYCARYNVLVSSGRTSSNFQQWPRGGPNAPDEVNRLRACFKARPGYLLCSVDFTGAELVSLAEVCFRLLGWSNLRDAINAGQNLHTRLAARFIGCSYEDAAKRVKAKDPIAVAARQGAKPCLGPETRVLTSRGWQAIVDVRRADLLWDGVEWVQHSGLVEKGVKETWTQYGIAATPDHGIWAAGAWHDWSKVLTSRSLFQSALDSVNLPLSHGTGTLFADGLRGSGLNVDALVDRSAFSTGLSLSAGTRRGAELAISKHLRKSSIDSTKPSCQKTSIVHGFWPDWMRRTSGALTQKVEPTGTTGDVASACGRNGSLTEQNSSGTYRHYRDGTARNSRWTGSITTVGTSQTISGFPRRTKTPLINERCQNYSNESQILKQSLPTYDLADAGPRHRFTIMTDAGPVLVHNCNFGLPGMMAPPRLVQAAHKDFVFFCELAGQNKECSGSRCRECLKLAEQYTRLFKEEWAEVPAYHRWIFANLRDPFYTPVTGFVRGGLVPSEAANHPFQHLTSRMSKSALLALSKECYTDKESVLYGTRPVQFQHDEIIAEIPEARAPEAADRMCEVMLKAGQKWTPNVKLVAEPALMVRWYKGAECVRDGNGRLLVWEPK